MRNKSIVTSELERHHNIISSGSENKSNEGISLKLIE